MKSLCILLLAFINVTAEPLDEWVNRATQNTRANDIAYANGLFVVVGNSGVEVSNDGSEWRRIPNVAGARFVGIHNDRFVSHGNQTVSTSTDGTNWVPRTFSPPFVVTSMAVWREKVVLVGETGSYWTSSDAINFQRFTVPTNSTLSSVSSANGLCFVSGSSFAFVSSNLTTWTKIRPDLALRAVTFAKGLYVGTADSSIYTSSDGVQWAKAEYGGSVVYDIIYASGYFIAGSAVTGLWTSHDGTNWTGRPTPAMQSTPLVAVAASPSRVVAGSADLPYLIQSGEIKPEASFPTLEIGTYPGITIPGVMGRSYRIEATLTPENASSWSPIKTLTLSESPFTWFDVNASDKPKRFYRAVLLP